MINLRNFLCFNKLVRMRPLKIELPFIYRRKMNTHAQIVPYSRNENALTLFSENNKLHIGTVLEGREVTIAENNGNREEKPLDTLTQDVVSVTGSTATEKQVTYKLNTNEKNETIEPTAGIVSAVTMREKTENFRKLDNLKTDENVKHYASSIILRELYEKRKQSLFDFKKVKNNKYDKLYKNMLNTSKQKRIPLDDGLNNDGLLISDRSVEHKRKLIGFNFTEKKFRKNSMPDQFKPTSFGNEEIDGKPYKSLGKLEYDIKKGKYNTFAINNGPTNGKSYFNISIIPDETLWHSYLKPNVIPVKKANKSKIIEKPSSYKYETKNVIVGNKMTKITYLVAE